MPESVNLKRLAKELNLSMSTVSRALRDSYEISAKTKERVFTLAQKLNYAPNPYAGSLRLKKSKTIAVIIPEITNNFFSRAINGVEDISNERKYHVLNYLTHEDYKKELSLIQHLKNGRIDGILISLAASTKKVDHIYQAIKNNIPVVLFDRIYDEIDVPKVIVNNYEGGFRATEHLIKNGCSRIAYLSTGTHLYTAQKRNLGYRKALKHYNIEYESQLDIQFDLNETDSDKKYKALYDLLKSKDRPDGIFSSVEEFAIKSYYTCRDLNLKIPEQIKIICFANLETAALLNPSLTTVTQPAYDMGKEAATLLFKLIENQYILPADKKVVFQTILKERDSTSKTVRPVSYIPVG